MRPPLARAVGPEVDSPGSEMGNGASGGSWAAPKHWAEAPAALTHHVATMAAKIRRNQIMRTTPCAVLG
jgi:hypothetical protein